MNARVPTLLPPLSANLQSPCFQRWIAEEQARMAVDVWGKEALTFSPTRMQCMSSPRCNLAQQALELDSERVLTNMLARLRKSP